MGPVVVLAWVVGTILGPTFHRNSNIHCALRHFNHWNLMPLDLEAFEVKVPIVRPCAVFFFGGDWGGFRMQVPHFL